MRSLEDNMFKGKRIFISGGNGVIGKELVSKLYSLGAIIFVGDLKPRPDYWPKDIIYCQGDLNYITKQELCYFKPEYFFHLAATFERSTETYGFWEENYHNNINLSNYLMSLLKDSEFLKRVVFASSYLIYNPDLYNFDKPAEQAYRIKESDNIYPRNLTGAAKLYHEIELGFLDDFKRKKFSSVFARIFRSYGKHSRDVISRLIRSLLRDETIEVYRREGMFDYIYAGEVTEGLIRLAEKKEVTGVVNLGNDNARRVDEVLKILNSHFPDMKTIEVEVDIPYEASQANMDYFYKMTGWKPKLQLEDTIPMLIEYEKNNPYYEESEVDKSNILITSISKKIPMINNIKKSSNKFGKNINIFGADINKNCIGRYFVYDFWEMPKTDDLSIDELIKFCKSKNITMIIPTRDGELLFWAKHKNRLSEENINVMISDYKVVEACIDKLLFFQKCKELGYSAISTFSTIEKVNSDNIVVKERFGAGSRKIGIGLNKNEAIERGKKMESPIFQPFIEGKEISVDMYISKTGEVKGVVTRRRDLVINGESQITTTFRNKELEEMCNDFAKDFKLYGHIVLQIMIDNKGKFNIIECNSRFGGASTISIASGLDSFYWFILESNGVDIKEYPFYRLENEIKQVRFVEDLILNDTNI